MTKYVNETPAEPEHDIDNLPLTYISALNVSPGNSEHPDTFAEPADSLRNMQGQTPVFKRKVTRELSKVRRGVGGAESKQIEDEAEYTGYQMFDVVLPPYNMDYLAKLYELSAPHYSAVNAKVSNIVGLGFKFVETLKTKRGFEQNSENAGKVKSARRRLERHREELHELFESFNEEDTFTESLVKVWRDYETIGNGYIEVSRKRDGSIGYIGHIPAQTMRIRKHRDGFVQISGHRVEFFANYGDNHNKDTGAYEPMTNPVGGGTPNEIIHLKKYSPTNGYYGIPDIIAAKKAIAGDEFAARFNLEYFENKAIPRYIITLKGTRLGAQSEANLLSFFETGLKGQNHRSLFIPLPPDTQDSKTELKVEPIEASVQDSSFTKYRQLNLYEILMSHRVPITKVGYAEGVSLAVARDADKTFKEQVCAPEQRMLEKKLNRLVRELSDALEIRLNEMTLTDADTQSKIDERMVKNGIWTPNEPRVRDGMAALPGGDVRVDLNAKANSAVSDSMANRQRDADRSANATDSAGEGRNPKGEGRRQE